MLQAARMQDGNVINDFRSEYSLEIDTQYYNKRFRGDSESILVDLISSLSDEDYSAFIEEAEASGFLDTSDY